LEHRFRIIEVDYGSYSAVYPTPPITNGSLSWIATLTIIDVTLFSDYILAVEAFNKRI